MIENFETEISAIKRWASKNPSIRKVWIYGSFISGNLHEGSDLDVAVEIEKEKGDTNKRTTWICEAQGWRDELQALLGFKLHLEWYDVDETPTVRKGIQSGSRLIYSKE